MTFSFNRHPNLEGQHAFLSASNYHWINYSEDKVEETYSRWRAAQREPNFTHLLLIVSASGRSCPDRSRH